MSWGMRDVSAMTNSRMRDVFVSSGDAKRSSTHADDEESWERSVYGVFQCPSVASGSRALMNATIWSVRVDSAPTSDGGPYLNRGKDGVVQEGGVATLTDSLKAAA